MSERLGKFSGNITRGNQRGVGRVQADCTVILNPGQSIQEAINKAKKDAVICLSEGTWYENLKIKKSLTLRGQGKERTIIKGNWLGEPVILIKNAEEIRVILEGLTIAEAKVGTERTYREDGISIWGRAKVTIKDSQITGNGNDGLEAGDSAKVTLKNSTVSENRSNGLWVGSWAHVIIERSTIEKNGSLADYPKNWISSGIQVVGKSQLAISNSIIRDNTGWGLAAWLKKCGYNWNLFLGKVKFQGNNQIYGNKRGDVCLP